MVQSHLNGLCDPSTCFEELVERIDKTVGGTRLGSVGLRGNGVLPLPIPLKSNALIEESLLDVGKLINMAWRCTLCNHV